MESVDCVCESLRGRKEKGEVREREGKEGWEREHEEAGMFNYGVMSYIGKQETP